MIRWFWGACVLVAATSVSNAEESAEELKKFEGTWKVTSMESMGKAVEAGEGVPDKAVVKDGRATFYSQGKVVETFKDLKLVLSPKHPQTLLLRRGEQEYLPCLYEITGDQWKLAMPMVPTKRKPDDPLPRPDSFETKGKAVVVLTAKRSEEME